MQMANAYKNGNEKSARKRRKGTKRRKKISIAKQKAICYNKDVSKAFCVCFVRKLHSLRCARMFRSVCQGESYREGCGK